MHIGAIGEGETASTSQVTEAARLLNMIVKLRSADGMPLWALKRGYLLPVTGVSSVQTDSHIVTTYDRTTLSAAEALGQTQLSVTSSSSMTAADQVGIEQDDGTMLWTTISSVDSSVLITVATALTAAAASGSQVFSYTASTDRIQKPLAIVHANSLDVSDDVSTTIDVVEREDYYSLGNRTSTSVGGPTLLFYDRVSNEKTDLLDGSIFFWPRFDDGNTIVEFTYQRPFQDFDASTDNPDFPPAFFLPLMLELAALLGPKFGIPIEDRNANFALAKVYREEALTTVYPDGSMRIQPEIQ
jgi:hypothetical protein